MVIASSFPLLEVFWLMLIFFAFVVWIAILFTIIGDLFRRHDTSGFVKVLWILLLIVLPYLGVFVYLISQHKGMTERQIERQKEAESQFSQYVQAAGVTSDPTEQIAKAKTLLDGGTINQAEFDKIKQQALGAA
jgi:Phospholipase_D-nuclease N-terminal